MIDDYNYSTTDEEICISLMDGDDQPWTAEKYPGCPWGFKMVKRAQFQENEVWRFLNG